MLAKTLSLRRLSLAGLAAAVATAQWGSRSVSEPQWAGFISVAVLAAIVGALMATVLRREASMIVRDLDLLVPFGCLLLLLTVAEWTLHFEVTAWIASATTINALGVHVPLSAYIVAIFVISVGYLAWQTQLVLDAVHGRPVDPEDALRRSLPLLVRHLVACVAVFFSFLLVFALLFALHLGGATATSATITAGLCVAINLATSALLLRLAKPELSGAEAAGRGVRDSLAHARRWSGLILLHLAVIGIATYAQTSGPNSHNAHWSVNMKWVGGYPEEFQWLETHMDVLDAQPLPILVFLSNGMLVLLALAIKLRFARDLKAADAPAGLDSPA